MSSDFNTIFSFAGTGLDTDSDLVSIQPGDSRYRRNSIISDDGNHNVITNSLGNTLKTNALLPGTGTNKIVGGVEDKEVDAFIFFNYNSGGNHGIYIYYSATGTFASLVSASWLGFQSDKFIDAGIIGNEDDRYLAFTDGFNVIRMINIELALSSPSSITDESSGFYKRPFTGDISVAYDYDSSYNGNNLKRKCFQFAVRLKYTDNTYSPLSSHSEIPIPDSENMPSGKLTGELDNNEINVIITMDHELNTVSRYQLLYRISDIGLGASGSWNIYDDYTYTATGVQSTISFKNDSSIGIISDAEAVRPFDFIPEKANHIGIIDSNRVVVDVAEEGFDNVDYDDSDQWDVSVASSSTAIPGGSDGIEVDATFQKLTTETHTFSYAVSSSVDKYIKVEFSTQALGAFQFFLYTIGSGNLQIGDSITTHYQDLITAGSIPGLVVTDNSTSSLVDVDFTFTGTSWVFEELIIGRSETFRTLNTGATYKFGIEYGYNGKFGSVQSNDDLILQVPGITTSTLGGYDYFLNGIIDINHTPPTDATEFRIVSFGTNVQFFEDYFVHHNSSDITDSTSDYTIYLDGEYTIIKRDDIVNRMISAYGGSGSGFYYGMDFEIGDIVRVIGGFGSLGMSTLGYQEYDIEAVTTSEIKISSAAIYNLDVSATSNKTQIQIIKKKSEFNSISNEFSKTYPIVSGFHQGNTINGGGGLIQTASYPCIIDVTEDFADTWKSYQVFVNSNNSDDYGFTYGDSFYGWMEKPRVSLYYDSFLVNQGRFNSVNEYSEKRGYNKIRWGGKFIDDAGVNFITRFESDDEKFLDDRNGPITKIQQIGDTLKVYQERKANSLYLKTTSADDPNGTSTFVFSDNVMSDPRQSVVDYGCTHFTSYVRDVRNSFFFDLGNKSALMDTPGGIVSITEGVFKMHTYFSQKSAAIVSYGKDLVQIHGTYDDDLDMYVLSFIVPLNLSHSINDTVAYHVPSKRWTTHFSLPTSDPVEYYGRLTGKTMVSFFESQLYLHNSNLLRNNFWGQQFDSEVWIHANESPISNKIFNSIEVNSTNQWDCPDDDSIEINKPSLMRSRLVAGRFKLQEGIYRSDFLRNALNKALSFIRNLLINGQILRGREMTIKLKNSGSSESQLETVVVRSSISK